MIEPLSVPPTVAISSAAIILAPAVEQVFRADSALPPRYSSPNNLVSLNNLSLVNKCFVNKSAGLLSPEIQRITNTLRRQRSRRNSAARMMCLVFLNAMASSERSITDRLSERMTVGPGVSKPRSARTSRKCIPSRAAIIAAKNSASVLERETDRCVFENQWIGHPIKTKIAPEIEN